MERSLQLLDVPPAAGSIDAWGVEAGRISVQGWMLRPGRPLDRVEGFLDGKSIGPARPMSRPDVDKALAWSTDARPIAFEIEAPVPERTPQRVDFLGYAKETPIARLSCLVPQETDERLPQPPRNLAERVSGAHGSVFRLQGLRMFTDLTDSMDRLGVPESGRILDWGCGCGRVVNYFLSRRPEAKLIGCDIDAEAIAWCRENLPARFFHVAPEPPLPLEDASVDAVIACSVLTHLDRERQERWLAEMRRILAPGGYFLGSTHGQYAFQLAHRLQPQEPRSWWRRLLGHRPASPILSGILDSQLDARLDGIAPPGYYRAVFQSRDYTLGAFSKHFEVADYLERGLNGHQDLVILRRPTR